MKKSFFSKTSLLAKVFIRLVVRAPNPNGQDNRYIDTRQLHRPATTRLRVDETINAHYLRNQHKLLIRLVVRQGQNP